MSKDHQTELNVSSMLKSLEDDVYRIAFLNEVEDRIYPVSAQLVNSADGKQVLLIEMEDGSAFTLQVEKVA